MQTTRRALLSGATVAIVGTVGCVGLGGSTDISVQNERGEQITVTLGVTTVEDGSELLSETFDLEPDGRKAFENVVSGSRVRVSVAVDGGPESTHEWSDGESDASGLFIDVESDSVEFTEAVA
ncbi:hypothetical protein [Haloarchaeobius sp. DT45]|uniref:hypothetical protein n=1 Tax=Haloarchaeobius sp. DT45 TaxID=3446116 RepID=UPI003F6A83A9